MKYTYTITFEADSDDEAAVRIDPQGDAGQRGRPGALMSVEPTERERDLLSLLSEKGREVDALAAVVKASRRKIVEFAVQVPMERRTHGNLLDIIDTLLQGFDPPSPQASAPALATRKGV